MSQLCQKMKSFEELIEDKLILLSEKVTCKREDIETFENLSDFELVGVYASVDQTLNDLEKFAVSPQFLEELNFTPNGL